MQHHNRTEVVGCIDNSYYNVNTYVDVLLGSWLG